MAQQTLPTIERELCPFCAVAAERYPGGVWQCVECCLVFTTRVKTIESRERHALELKNPERKQPPEANPEAVHLSGSVRQHGAACGANNVPYITRTVNDDCASRD